MAKNDPAPAPAAPQDPLSALLAAHPELAAALAGGNTSQSNFMGLPGSGPEGTGANVDIAPGAPSTATKVPPRYTAGAEMIPVRANATPQQIGDLQDRLVDAGLLDGPFQRGWWDNKSQAAFAQILGNANNSGNDWDTELTNAINNGTTSTVDPKTGKIIALTPGQKKLKSVSLSYTNSDDLATVANQTAQDKLGRYLTQDELNHFVNSFHDMQTGKAQNLAAGLPATDASSPDVAATTFAEQEDPVAYKARQGLGMIQAINGALSGMGLGEANPK